VIGTTAENAIHAWIVAASQLAAGNVVWAEQGAPRPTGPYIAMRLTNIRPRGRDWTEALKDGAGNVTMRVRGVRHATLAVQCYGGDGGVTDAVGRLSRLVARTELPSVQDPLMVAKVGVLGYGGVQSVGALMNYAAFEPRATLDVRLALAIEIVESLGTGGIIESADGSGEVGSDLEGVAFDVP